MWINKRKYIILLLIVFCVSSLCAQRRVTPVDVDDKKPTAPTLHYYDKHGNPLAEPVLFLTSLDTVPDDNQRSAPVYPAFGDISMGLNFFDAVMAIAGQKYGGIDLCADMSVYNWLFPAVELGIGYAHNTPSGGNFTYKGHPSVYAKLGVNYNFLYKSNPDHQLFVGFRAGFSRFGYDISNIDVTSSYWNQTARFSIDNQISTAFYGELLAGLKVKIYKAFSMGWTFRYHFMMHCSDGENAVPYYIPGYGKRTGHIGATFSIIYTLPWKF